MALRGRRREVRDRMIQTVQPGMRAGTVHVPASKSMAHRQLIAAALSEEPCTVICDGVSKDIEATARCLNALGAEISYEESGNAFRVIGVKRGKEQVPEGAYSDLFCVLIVIKPLSKGQRMVPLLELCDYKKTKGLQFGKIYCKNNASFSCK